MTLSLILTLRPGLPRARLPLVILGLIGDRFPDGINQVWEWEPSGGWLPGGGSLSPNPNPDPK